MTDVFVSYKRDDEIKVGRLVATLEKSGLTVWWDRALPGAENWREGIANALEDAKCTVVVWTRSSTGPDGGFVRDEASRAARAGRLVPVMLDRVDPPLGFGELQAIDLSRWRGKANDEFFQDLVAAVKAKIDGRAVPRPKGPMARIRRRITAASVVTAATAVLAAFASNTLKLQDRLCELPIGQPQLADTCGALSLSGSPTRTERLAWEGLTPGNCANLKTYLVKYPKGAFRDEARALLDTPTVSVEQSWQTSKKPMPLRLMQSKEGAAQATEDLARDQALKRAEKRAERMCRDFDAAGVTRLKSAEVSAQDWACDKTREGTVCGFDGIANCWQEVVVTARHETCGKDAKR